MMLRNYFWTVLLVVGIAMPQMVRAFPSEEEIKTATDVVGDLVADDVRAANSGKKNREDVAKQMLELVDQAETDAAKWVLFQQAFIQYAKAKDYAKAGETMTTMLENFPDVSPQTVVSLIEKNCPKANAKSAPRMAQIRKTMLLRKKCQGIIALGKASPKEMAEAQCLMGNWEKGLALFKSVGGKVGEIAAAELDGSQPKHVVAGFWWDYASELDTCDQFKAHAVQLYKDGLADSSITGLYKNVAEKRIAEIEAAPTVAAPEPQAAGKFLKYCIIDLSSGSNSKRYPVTYCSKPPVRSWTDEYKTTKLVLKRIEKGRFTMGGQANGRTSLPVHQVTLTEPFYIGVFELTQRQWELVTGRNPARHKAGGTFPVESVSWNMVPDFLRQISERTGLAINLPTEAQWEYACRANTTSCFSYGNTANGDYMWFEGNFDGKISHPVGTRKPNPWGLYDMHGNVLEWCREWFGPYPDDPVIDPTGATSGSARVRRGGAARMNPNQSQSFNRSCYGPSTPLDDTGLRLACPIPK